MNFFMCVLFGCLALGLLFSGAAFAQQIAGNQPGNQQVREPDRSVENVRPAAPPPARIQSAESIALDDQLAREMHDYRLRFREFRHALRSKFPRGEDRVAAIERWRKQHKEWMEDWQRRSERLDEIWNWGPEGKPKAPQRVDDLTTAQGRVAAAIRKIRHEEKGTGKAGDSIARWMTENKNLMEQAEAERVLPLPPEDNRPLTGNPKERELQLARSALSRIRKELQAQGKDALKAAMRNPNSDYTHQKRIVARKIRTLEAVGSKAGGNTTKGH